MMQSFSCDKQVQALESTFIAIQQERMQGIPILNPALHVEAVGFQTWENACLGILITPWFMNLLILPLVADKPAQLPSTDEKKSYQFPSGIYEFLVSYEANLGIYQSCSLFSPMFDFADQAMARETAQAILTLLMTAPEPKANVKKGISRRELLRGKA